MNLTVPVNATISDNQGIGTITDDDAAPALAIGDVTVTEGNATAVNAVFTVSLAATSALTVDVDYATADGTALSTSDYTAAERQPDVHPGQSSKLLTVAVTGDTLDENTETFVVNLSNPTNATLGDDQGQATITDNDSATLAIGDVSVTEADSTTVNAVFTVSLSLTSALTVTVDYASDGRHGHRGQRLHRGQRQPDVRASADQPDAHGGGERRHDLRGQRDLHRQPEQRRRCHDRRRPGDRHDHRERRRHAVLTVGDVSVTEGNGGTTPAVFTVSLTGTRAVTATVSYSTPARAARAGTTSGTDYHCRQRELTFLPADASKTITVLVTGETTAENNETYTLTLSSPVNATCTGGDCAATGTIVDDDTAAFSISDVTVTEGDATPVNAVFTVTLSPASATDQTVRYSTSNGTATAGQRLYEYRQHDADVHGQGDLEDDHGRGPGRHPRRGR